MRKLLLLVALAMSPNGCGDKHSSGDIDIAYSSEWKFSVEGPVSGYVVIVNTTSAPVNLDTLQLTSVTDDNPTANVQIETQKLSGVQVAPGIAGGVLSPVSKNVLVDSGIITEPRDANGDYLTIAVVNAPAGTYDIHASVEMSLEGKSAKLPLTIHMVPGPTIFAEPIAGTRVRLQ